MIQELKNQIIQILDEVEVENLALQSTVESLSIANENLRLENTNLNQQVLSLNAEINALKIEKESLKELASVNLDEIQIIIEELKGLIANA